jgi:hypothetical protein
VDLPVKQAITGKRVGKWLISPVKLCGNMKITGRLFGDLIAKTGRQYESGMSAIGSKPTARRVEGR